MLPKKEVHRSLQVDGISNAGTAWEGEPASCVQVVAASRGKAKSCRTSGLVEFMLRDGMPTLVTFMLPCCLKLLNRRAVCSPAALPGDSYVVPFWL